MRSPKASTPSISDESALCQPYFMYPHLPFLDGIKKISAIMSFHLKMFQSVFLTDKHLKKTKCNRNIIIKLSVNSNS